MERTRAVFERHDRAEQAVRDLTEHGVGLERILVTQTHVRRDEPRRRPIFGIPHPLHGAGLGAALGMLCGLALSASPEGATLFTLWLVIVGTFLGAAVGGSLGLLLGLWRRRADGVDWLVRVDTETPQQADRAEQVLRRHGGDVLHPA